MGQWGDFFVDVAAWTLALLAAFEGARRIANGRRSRGAVILIAAGVVWCVLRGGLSLYVSRSLDAVAEGQRSRSIAELSQDWGVQLSPPEREKASLAYARVAFKDAGVLLAYFNQAGDRLRFAPTQEDLRERDATVELWQRLENTSLQAQSQAFRLLLSVVVALVAGIAIGMRYDG